MNDAGFNVVAVGLLLLCCCCWAVALGLREGMQLASVECWVMSSLDYCEQALRMVKRRDGRCRRWLRMLQMLLDATLECRTAYAGSLGLWICGEVDRFGDLDVVTNRLWNDGDLPWHFDGQSRFGWKCGAVDLDIFYVNRPDNRAMMELANRHIVEVDGIRVQGPQFTKEINWFWRGGKDRLMIPSNNAELGKALS